MTGEEGWSKSPNHGQRSTNRRKGARSNPKSEETPRLARQKGKKISPHSQVHRPKNHTREGEPRLATVEAVVARLGVGRRCEEP